MNPVQIASKAMPQAQLDIADVDLLKNLTMHPQRYYMETERTVIGQIRLLVLLS